MSVRRRKVRERIHRELKELEDYRKFSIPLKRIQELCERKIAAKEQNLTAEEISACFASTAREGL